MRTSWLAPLALLALAGCSVGQGTGDVRSNNLFAHDCWGTLLDAGIAQGGPYDMQPNYFAADPYLSTLTITVQSGSDISEYSDGLGVLIDDVDTIRAAIAAQADGGVADSGAADGGVADSGAADGGGYVCAPSPGPTSFQVAIPAGVSPSGAPAQPPPCLIANPAIVHMSLYLNRTCPSQNIVLYGVSGFVTFTALFDGNLDETSADKKLTEATFDAQFADLNDAPFGEYAGDVPAGLQSRVTGSFRFYFERGQPGQPFP